MIDDDDLEEETLKTTNNSSNSDELLDYLLVTGEIDDHGRKPRKNGGCLGSIALFCLIGSAVYFLGKQVV
jgi:hypothetical protein